MVLGRPNLGRILTTSGIITEDQLESALQYQIDQGCRLGEALRNLGLCTDIQIAQALAEQLEIPFVDLQEVPPSPSCVALIPREVALEYGVLPVRMEGDRLLVAARDPFDVRVDEVVRLAAEVQVVLAIAPESQLCELLHQFYNENVFEETLSRVSEEPETLEEEAQQVSLEQLIAGGEQLSAVRVVNVLIVDAVRRMASDLHIEPEETRVRVRYRIDGRLRHVVSLRRDLLSNVVARVKIMCGMDISENRKPQDGGCRVRVDGREIELRVSTLRGVHGEIVVIRVLNQDANLHRLPALGFDATLVRDVRRLLAVRQGLILIAGPTGSGKTTTLYAALNHLNREDLNIMTVEDPVEMKLPGINQIQVHDRAGRTFAATLRSMLRQDPDVIMVGEIRDVETADIACRAALTGHLVLSTIHTQHALGTIARLLDMGVAPWLVGACLKGVLAQRLVRRVCEHCAAPYTLPDGLLHALETVFGGLSDAHFAKGQGCSACHRTGVRGRMGVYELLMVDEDLRHRMTEAKSPKELREYIVRSGFRSIESDAFSKACLGLIPPEEVVDLGFGAATAMDDLIQEDERTGAVNAPSSATARGVGPSLKAAESTCVVSEV
jgi:type IV pilus assembly protein PilB